ncbi:family 2 encapsulin nanocompartment cargo protein terpene cyclase [Streptomyces sp. NBC_00193]|uniref:family 2 encapsulin nanocompartment cargo protein terpene cyclase n=1 Tax=unclassified Streptomyces TaxID=2593676 RepID=UPI002251565D|nr:MULTISPECIES: family 2 encapsulin nanocompartment cargo protein terpene cyclase [unclassified Streptomyces]MCX5128085.1 family 2 encapsulin nanocompartment cargo protein terpene cyclase [Streptomyces sp. NBC_00347]MCX5301020.1 family 2 encapsulin nanocompartment cargo protein terpene cyclase [Streptomyces sp. NBC_00193]
MPEPGPSPLQSSLPGAAVQFGAHVLGSAQAHATGGLPSGPAVPGRPSVPAEPSVPAGPAVQGPAAPVRPAVPSRPALPGPAGLPGPSVPSASAVAPAPPAPSPALLRLLGGPSGLGTEGLHPARRGESPPVPAPVAAPEPGAPAAGNPIPGLYHHPVPEPDPVRVAEVSRRIKAWAVEEVDLFPDAWENQFDGFHVGRYMVACHPDAPTIEHLMVATRLMVAENAVDDCYCEDHGGSPIGLGGRLLLAHTAIDPLHTTKEYEPQWAASLRSDAPRRAYTSAMEYFVRQASPSQTDRYRHDMARLHLGYLAEAAWSQTEYVPEVWEYLAMRQFNNFRPCPTITDTVGGYELPADLHAQAAMQRVIALAGNATTIVNDLYSYTKELAAPVRHMNLPVVIADREGTSDKEGYLKAVEVHNDLMHAFEAEAAALAAACPVPSVLRFLRGVAVWVDGNHYWHQTNTYRYSLPDFW